MSIAGHLAAAPRRYGARLSLRPRAGKSTSAATPAVGAPATAGPRAPGFPMLPVLGSLPWVKSLALPSGERVDATVDHHRAFAEGHRRFGPVWRIGIPGIGAGLSGEVHICADPREFMKALRAEGKFPFGAIMLHWPAISCFRETGRTVAKLYTRTEDWRRMRHGFQKDLLPPAAALSYAPAIADAASDVVLNAPLWEDASAFMSRASFDLFSTLTLGRRTRTSDPSPGAAEPAASKFAGDTIDALDSLVPVMQHLPSLLARGLGLKSGKRRGFERAMLDALDYSDEAVRDIIERWDRGAAFTDAEQRSYAVNTLRRQRAEAAETGRPTLADEDIVAAVSLTLIASVDTTSSITCWTLAHLAREPAVQQRVREEVRAALAEGPLEAAIGGDGAGAPGGGLPYLKAVVREAHRLTPALVLSSIKQMEEDVELSGFRVPRGALVALDNHSLVLDPRLLDEPEAFRPERWLPEGVAARKGTAAEVLDHPILSAPFSAGARKCPGYRVASLEMRALLAGLVDNWQIGLADPSERSAPIAYHTGTTLAPIMPKLSYAALTPRAEQRLAAAGGGAQPNPIPANPHDG